MGVKLYSDGACKGNPGPGGYGTLIISTIVKDGIVTTVEKTLSEGYKKTTNNRMELMGIIKGLSVLKKTTVDVYTDSSYVVNMFNKKWVDNWKKNGWKNAKGEDVKNVDLIMKLMKLIERMEKVEFHWVKGHNGHPENERCDKMAVESALNPQNMDLI